MIMEVAVRVALEKGTFKTISPDDMDRILEFTEKMNEKVFAKRLEIWLRAEQES